MGDAIVNAQTKKFITDGLALGYRYDGSPICWREDGPAPPQEVAEYHPTAYTGGRAPHAWLGEGRSIIDRYGRGFRLMRFGDAPDPSGLERAFASRSVPLAIETITDPSAGTLYERRLVLVRPDGHVAWRADAIPADPLALVDRVRGA
jgi:hypothetical protein